VAFPAELVPELRWHLDRFAAPGERGLVFVGPKGARLRRSNFRPVWKAACEQAGVPGMHFHDLRITRSSERRCLSARHSSRLSRDMPFACRCLQ
jgi:integrase